MHDYLSVCVCVHIVSGTFNTHEARPIFRKTLLKPAVIFQVLPSSRYRQIKHGNQKPCLVDFPITI